jgi:hypothetical protein
MTNESDTKRAESQAKSQFESIKEMVETLNKAEKTGKKVKYDGDTYDADGIRERINEDPLCVEVRSDWHTPGDKNSPMCGGEYNILLCTGGPACRIIGDLSEHGEPETARIEYQDWFTPWINWPMSGEDQDIVLTYARCLYFGE